MIYLFVPLSIFFFTRWRLAEHELANCHRAENIKKFIIRVDTDMDEWDDKDENGIPYWEK